MRWKAREKRVKPKPKTGDERVQFGFAVFPVRCGDVVVWLERYVKIQTFQGWSALSPDGGPAVEVQGWRTVRKELCAPRCEECDAEAVQCFEYFSNDVDTHKLWFCANHASKRSAVAIDNAARDLYLRKKAESALVNFPVGQRLIVRSNEDGPLLIGSVSRHDRIGMSHVPVLKDDAGKEFLCLGAMSYYTEERHQALMKLNPREQWLAMTHYTD
jgi:hypothetical protein